MSLLATLVTGSAEMRKPIARCPGWRPVTGDFAGRVLRDEVVSSGSMPSGVPAGGCSNGEIRARNARVAASRLQMDAAATLDGAHRSPAKGGQAETDYQ